MNQGFKPIGHRMLALFLAALLLVQAAPVVPARAAQVSEPVAEAITGEVVPETPVKEAAPETPAEAPVKEAAPEAPAEAPVKEAAPEAPVEAPAEEAAPEAPAEAPAEEAIPEKAAAVVAVAIEGEREYTIGAGEMLGLNAVIVPKEAEGEILWSVDDDTLAVIEQDGTLTALDQPGDCFRGWIQRYHCCDHPDGRYRACSGSCCCNWNSLYCKDWGKGTECQGDCSA